MRPRTMLPILALALLACATPETVHRRSSLSAYLGGKPAAPGAEASQGPVRLQLPLRLGLAFVPAEASLRQGGLTAVGPGGAVDPAHEQELQDKVAKVFSAKPWTLSFKAIPSLYLKKGGGFEDLEQVTRSFGVDVVALVSVDQIQFSSPRWYSWTYWTVVGAYMVKGDQDDTTTLVDAAVYHVPSRTFLFRAGGVGTAKGSSTWSKREEAFRQQSRDSLALAMANLSANLDSGVEGFKQELAKGIRKDVQLVDRDGHVLGTPDYDPRH